LDIWSIDFKPSNLFQKKEIKEKEVPYTAFVRVKKNKAKLIKCLKNDFYLFLRNVIYVQELVHFRV
jgi:hypothetical protein